MNNDNDGPNSHELRSTIEDLHTELIDLCEAEAIGLISADELFFLVHRRYVRIQALRSMLQHREQDHGDL